MPDRMRRPGRIQHSLWITLWMNCADCRTGCAHPGENLGTTVRHISNTAGHTVWVGLLICELKLVGVSRHYRFPGRVLTCGGRVTRRLSTFSPHCAQPWVQPAPRPAVTPADPVDARRAPSPTIGGQPSCGHRHTTPPTRPHRPPALPPRRVRIYCSATAPGPDTRPSAPCPWIPAEVAPSGPTGPDAETGQARNPPERRAVRRRREKGRAPYRTIAIRGTPTGFTPGHTGRWTGRRQVTARRPP